MVDGVAGSTAVPQYIKDMEDYNETYNKNAGGDGPTYYADWTNAELQWFTKQFYTDFSERYNNDPRIGFVELGFGHWSEYQPGRIPFIRTQSHITQANTGSRS